MQPQIMIDIETMDTVTTAAICSIGAVVFDNTGLNGVEFYKIVDWSVQTQRTISGDTVQWWMQQEAAAQAEILKPGISLYKAINALLNWLPTMPCSIWANGIMFDVAILEHAIKQEGFIVPWKYHAALDMRVLKRLSIVENNEIEENPVQHNALEDAKWQARYVALALQRIDELRTMHLKLQQAE